MNNDPIKVILVDDHFIVRAGYRRLLESTADICVVAEAENGETGCIAYFEYKPDVMILDLNMPGIGGFEALRRIKAKDPAARILIFSMNDNVTTIQRILAAGAAGYLTKQSGIGQMIEAIRQVHQGKLYIDSLLSPLRSKQEGSIK